MAAIFATGIALAAGTNEADYQVVPLPRQIDYIEGNSFTLNCQTQIAYPAGDKAMERNAQFLAEYIKEVAGISVATTTAKTKGSITLALSKKIAGDEEYRITVKEKGVSIEGKTAAGVFYGIQTLRKALPIECGAAEIVLPGVTIADAPRFGYRGMMLDCCRHFFPLSFVKKYIDLLALHNMNRFHWHLNDDQGWRIEIKKRPKLTQIGSVRPTTVLGHNSGVFDGVEHGGYYTQEEAREIVRYAAERYITVVPEIDMPGHMLAALASYPELGCTGGPYTVGRTWGIFPEVLCLGNEKIYQFCQDVLSEIIDIFPSKYIHIGGDEAPRDRWRECAKCKALASREGLTIDKLQGYFTNRMEKFVNSKGRSIIGWDEILEGDINQSATIMSWRGPKPGSHGAQLGHDVIMAPNNYCYFDYYQTNETSHEPMLIGGWVPVEKVYELEPVPDSLSVEAKQHIIGVQANLWTEYIGSTNLVEYQILPRAAALAEVQWTDGKKDYDAFRKRLDHMADLYDHYRLVFATHLWPGRKIKANGEYVEDF
ncbi:MAG: beta-N-acetylhexosaminidase [Prevotella sp.]|nr:beta-N-acetylhexosaminidase [Prevotella sp.]